MFHVKHSRQAGASEPRIMLDTGVTMGPLANPRRLEAMEAIVQDCKSRGGKIVTGGKRRGNQGYFFEPTVVTDLPDDCKLMTEEPFGPIAPIVQFKSFDEILAAMEEENRRTIEAESFKNAQNQAEMDQHPHVS